MNYTKAKIIADSINVFNGQRVTTFEVVFPRFILAEFNTHKMIEKNFSSSRAVPFLRMIENTDNMFYTPSKWGKNCSGMSSGEYITDDDDEIELNTLWQECYWYSNKSAREMFELNVHKQWCNRLIEPFQYVKGICTATDYDNFFWLRIDEAAQPEMRDLAEKMKHEYDNSAPKILQINQWHIPYFLYSSVEDDYNCIIDGKSYELNDALKISVSLCAQVSYRKEDVSLEKAQRIEDLLLNSGKLHASPYGHQATPIYDGFNQKGVTHMFKNGLFGSGNLVGWVQHRHLMDNPDMCNHK